MQVDGECLCGAIGLEAEVDPRKVFVCHCDDCQVHTASAFRVLVAVTPDALRITRGEPRRYQKVAESGRRRILAFCADCGTAIYGGPAAGEEGAMSIRAGVLRQRAELRPVLHVWSQSALPWVHELGDLPRIDKQG